MSDFSECPVKEGQFAIIRSWGDFTLRIVRVDALTPKLIKEREGFRGGRERFSQTPRADVLLAFDSEQCAERLVEAAKKIKREYNEQVSFARRIAQKQFDELLANAQADRSPEGQDAVERLDRNDESAVNEVDAPDAPKGD